MTVEMTVWTCPRDGTILADIHRLDLKHFECPSCRSVYPVEKVAVTE